MSGKCTVDQITVRLRRLVWVLAGRGPPATCRQNTTGAGRRSPRSTQCGRRGGRLSWSHPRSIECTAWPPWACPASPGGPGSAGSCRSSCCSPRTSGESSGGWGRYSAQDPPHPRCTEPSRREVILVVILVLGDSFNIEDILLTQVDVFVQKQRSQVALQVSAVLRHEGTGHQRHPFLTDKSYCCFSFTSSASFGPHTTRYYNTLMYVKMTS